MTIFCTLIDIDKIRIGIVMSIYSFLKRIMALDLCQNFVPAQYIKNKRIGFDRILHMN